MTEAAPPDIDQLFRYFSEVMILSHLATTAFEAAMTDGMTMAQFGVLNHLQRVGNGQTQGEVARAMQVRKSTMTSMLRGLSEAGHVTVTPDLVDRRTKRVHITPAGQAARLAAIKAVTPEMEAIGREVQPQDVTAGLPALERVRRIMDARRD
jgi:DNA-binding MarR family transcriptional regulator